MTPITIPLHLLIPTAVSLTSLVFLLVKRNSLKKKYFAFYPAIILFFSSYAIFVGNALGHDIYYQWDLNRYDLNQDGIFESPTETTPAQELAMTRLINDTGRNFSIITAFIVSGILSLCIYILKRLNHALFEAEENNEKNNHLNNIHSY